MVPVKPVDAAIAAAELLLQDLFPDLPNEQRNALFGRMVAVIEAALVAHLLFIPQALPVSQLLPSNN